MNACLRILLERRGAALVLLIAISLAALVGVGRLGFDDRYHEAFRSDDARYEHLQLLTEAFGAGDADCVVVVESSDVLARSSLEALRRMHRRFGELAEVESVTSLFSVRGGRRVGRLFLPLLPGPDATDETLERARQGVVGHPLVAGRLLAGDRRTSLLHVRLRSEMQSIDGLEPILRDLRRIAAECAAGSDVRPQLTGIPAIRVETIRRLEREHIVVTAAGAVCATLVAWLMLRRWAAVVVVVMPALVGVLWTLGAIGLAGRSLNAMNIVLPPLVMVIGISDSIHVMFHFREACAEGLTPREAIIRSIRELVGACSLTALTTSVGFLSLLYSHDRILGELGIFGGLGVCLTFLSVMTWLPLICTTSLGRASLAGVPSQISAASHGAEQGASWSDRIYDIVAPRAHWLAPLLLLVAIGAFGSARGMRSDFRFLENLTEESESCRAMRRIEATFGGAPLLQVLVAWPEGVTPESRELHEVLMETHAAIERCTVARAPTSVLTLLECMPAAQGDIAARWAELRRIPADRLRSSLDETRRLALVAAYVPDAGAAALRAPLEDLERELAAIAAHRPGFRIITTGFVVTSTYRAGAMIADLFEGLAIEVFVILIVITLALRSWKLGLLSLPSNLFPLLLTVAVMRLFGLKLQYSTVLALNICLGIAVDDTVHFLSRYRRELELDGDRHAAVRRSFRAVAPAMGAATLLMLTGFGAGIFCSIPTVRDFSLCACTALILALASEAVVMPTALVCVARMHDRRRTAASAASSTAAPNVSSAR